MGAQSSDSNRNGIVKLTERNYISLGSAVAIISVIVVLYFQGTAKIDAEVQEAIALEFTREYEEQIIEKIQNYSPWKEVQSGIYNRLQNIENDVIAIAQNSKEMREFEHELDKKIDRATSELERKVDSVDFQVKQNTNQLKEQNRKLEEQNALLKEIHRAVK